jgi:hypothetical protein
MTDTVRVKKWHQWFWDRLFQSDLLPRFTNEQWIEQIELALQSRRYQQSSLFSHRWVSMTHAEKILWVRRRQAALLIIWARGGKLGFQEPGLKLQEALNDIDR